LTVKSTLSIFSIIAVAGCSTLTPSQDPVFLKLTDVEARLLRIERVVENESLISLAGEIQGLRNDTQALRGEVETLRFETDGAATRQRDLYVDLDDRLQQLEQARVSLPVQLPPAAGVQGSPAPAATAAVNDQQAYNTAFEMIQARRYAEAATAFGSFLTRYPSSPLKDNAQYWLAETHYVQRSFSTALPEFQRVIDDYPQSAKLPDALLRPSRSRTAR
jgi:tol-pal system protein YbgF